MLAHGAGAIQRALVRPDFRSFAALTVQNWRMGPGSEFCRPYQGSACFCAAATLYSAISGGPHHKAPLLAVGKLACVTAREIVCFAVVAPRQDRREHCNDRLFEKGARSSEP